MRKPIKKQHSNDIKQKTYSRRKNARKVSSVKLKAIFSPEPPENPVNASDPSFIGTSTPVNTTIWDKSKQQRRKSFKSKAIPDLGEPNTKVQHNRISKIQDQSVVNPNCKSPLFTPKVESKQEEIIAENTPMEPVKRKSSSVILVDDTEIIPSIEKKISLETHPQRKNRSFKSLLKGKLAQTTTNDPIDLLNHDHPLIILK